MTNLPQAIATRLGISYDRTDDRWIPIICPFHTDTNPSASINFAYRMFTCKAGCPNMTFIRLAERLSVDYTGWDHSDAQSDDWLNYLTEVLPKRSLKQQAKAYTDFLLSRKIKPETIEEFNGEYISDQTHQDYGHLVIPYGRNKYVKRRIIGESENRFRQSGNQGHGDSKSLFGKPENWGSRVILCEGLTDFFTLWQEGFKEGCSSFGANTSENQMYLLRNRTVFIVFDRDYAGFIGAQKAAAQLKKFNAIPIILEIPERFGEYGEKIDINSAYVHSGDDFLSWLRSSINSYCVFDTDYISNTFLENKRTVVYVPSGIKSLDSSLNGGFATGLHAIAGMPEAGKSTLVSYLIEQFHCENQKILLLSYELTKEQIWSRLASIHDVHTWSDIEKDHTILTDRAKALLSPIAEKVRIENNWTIEQIKVAANNFDVIIVDYAQRMPFDGTDERAGIKNNCRELSNLTRDGKIVILISSIPRSMYDKEGKNVFKETGDIEYICQSGYILTKMTPDVACLKMIKNTRGVCKDIFLKMNYAHQQIEETVKPDLRTLME